jgi:hypothetical protein
VPCHLPPHEIPSPPELCIPRLRTTSITSGHGAKTSVYMSSSVMPRLTKLRDSRSCEDWPPQSRSGPLMINTRGWSSVPELQLVTCICHDLGTISLRLTCWYAAQPSQLSRAQVTSGVHLHCISSTQRREKVGVVFFDQLCPSCKRYNNGVVTW